jgi:dolichol-phosphate mannosyltransferase
MAIDASDGTRRKDSQMTTSLQSPAEELGDGTPATAAASVAIVVPAYNEQANLDNLFRELEAATVISANRYRIVLVDDGSIDDTAAMAEAYQGPLVIDLVKQGVNKGLGAALMAGFLRALEDPHVEVVVTIEADTTSDLSRLDAMVATVTDGRADLAQGSMHHPEGEMVDVSGFRALTSKVASLVMRIATGSKLDTFTNLYRAVSAPVLRRSLAKRGDRLISEPGFAGVTELLLNLLRDGARVVEGPITLDAATRVDESKMPIWPTVRAQVRVARKAFVGRLLRT